MCTSINSVCDFSNIGAKIDFPLIQSRVAINCQTLIGFSIRVTNSINLRGAWCSDFNRSEKEFIIKIRGGALLDFANSLGVTCQELLGGR